MPYRSIKHALLLGCLSLLINTHLFACEGAATDSNSPCAKSENQTIASLAKYQQQYPDITYQELRQLLPTGKVLLVDANRPETYASGHIPGAISFNDKANLRTHLKYPKNMTVVVYCGGSHCIAWHSAADWAAAEGFQNIRHFSAGLRGWKLEGGEVIAMNSKTLQ
ncbi:hypothetical protein GCM10023116_21830 [Kistimonas scapharcae]|uniref:Rhodanese domain-containing protein n=1 Tax=Kistimonas scapharcae TaxID=1036133 RepID=A0ABP8V1Z8_9GAMM